MTIAASLPKSYHFLQYEDPWTLGTSVEEYSLSFVALSKIFEKNLLAMHKNEVILLGIPIDRVPTSK